MINRILTTLDNNSRRETFAVVANLIDWSKAFPRQCPKLGVESFIDNNVRPSLIPVLISYFQNRRMTVKWHGCTSLPRTLNGGGPQGATIGLLEYLSQSNHSADCVGEQDRYKFVDDLTILEIVNLLTVGITSFNLKAQIPNDIPDHNQFIPPNNLKSQDHLHNINQWTINQKMKINQKKSKTIIFNFTKNYQFTTRLDLNGESLEVVKETKLLGTIIQNDLKWDSNTSKLVKSANARMRLLHKLSEFGAPRSDLVAIYTSYIRSILEQNATVWHSSLTNENQEDLERVQKSAFKVILKQKYKSYNEACIILNLEPLYKRRQELCTNFAIKSVKNSSIQFNLNDKIHPMQTRNPDKFKVTYCNTDRLLHSAIPQMELLLNKTPA